MAMAGISRSFHVIRTQSGIVIDGSVWSKVDHNIMDFYSGHYPLLF